MIESFNCKRQMVLMTLDSLSLSISSSIYDIKYGESGGLQEQNSPWKHSSIFDYTIYGSKQTIHIIYGIITGPMSQTMREQEITI